MRRSVSHPLPPQKQLPLPHRQPPGNHQPHPPQSRRQPPQRLPLHTLAYLLQIQKIGHPQAFQSSNEKIFGRLHHGQQQGNQQGGILGYSGYGGPEAGKSDKRQQRGETNIENSELVRVAAGATEGRRAVRADNRPLAVPVGIVGAFDLYCLTR